MTEKTCNTCKQTKPVKDFYKASKGNYAHECKKCVKAKYHAKRSGNITELFCTDQHRVDFARWYGKNEIKY